MEFFNLDWLLWFNILVIGYWIFWPLYKRRVEIKAKVASTKFSIGYLLFLTLILALCFHVSQEWKRSRSATLENQRLNGLVRYERSQGVALEEQVQANQKRILDFEQLCEDSETRINRETSSQARNEFALDRLGDSWKRLESEIQIQERPGFISLLPLPVKDTDTSVQDESKRYQIFAAPDDQLELVFKVFKRKRVLEDYQWDRSKNPDGPFSVVKVDKENESMRFLLPPGVSIVELRIYDRRSARTKGVFHDEIELLELMINGESATLVAMEGRYFWFKGNCDVAVQLDYPRENLETPLEDVSLFARDKGVRLQMYLYNKNSQSDDDATVTNGAVPEVKLESDNE